MREPNFSLPAQNRAAVVITSTLYDRRALDCTAILPLINSLTHLTYMTSTSPRIREILVLDGGLERLVRILHSAGSIKPGDRKSMWKWSLAFQCVVNVGVRGSEQIRTRVVQAGMIPVIVAVLDNFFKTMEQVKMEKEKCKLLFQQQPGASGDSTTSEVDPLSLHPSHTRSTPIHPSRPLFTPMNADPRRNFAENENRSPSQPNLMRPLATTFTSPSDVYPIDRTNHDVGDYAANEHPRGDQVINGTNLWMESRPNLSPPSSSSARRTTFPLRSTPTPIQPQSTTNNTIPLLDALSTDAPLHRDEDILLSLQLLAYISKYPHLRTHFHEHAPCNVFSLVEKFTHRLHPPAIQYWAGVIMRNACRKDESRGGVRQCAFMQCGRWERYPREFAKCRRCRKAKYCSKQCQSKAWSEGHRWWCVERTHTSSSHFNAQASTGVSTPIEEPSENPQTTTEPVIAINEQPIGMERATTPAVTAEPPNTAIPPNEPPPTIVQRTFGNPPTHPNLPFSELTRGMSVQDNLERHGMDVQE
ncbi:hypothetical protein K450DRAFT_252579 [Umbelopsis ramanniana AG]|uniref:MYND-type domain-containing protein n=1 Tax=Umbelopsis ramanniana AG TaxID=1314678 RepID=A0AAD5E4C1_UMBRA|nr:uncharacterized protein K450DRAFT_252579 [Umbelopsis ramanniana AG]KAI8577318.1 hypothetical protein K450DRAFT_252579 [Umbelopsis ramanniana AG]